MLSLRNILNYNYPKNYTSEYAAIAKITDKKPSKVCRLYATIRPSTAANVAKIVVCAKKAIVPNATPIAPIVIY